MYRVYLDVGKSHHIMFVVLGFSNRNNLPLGVLVSGRVIQSGKTMGATNRYVSRFRKPVGHDISRGVMSSSRSPI